MKRRADRSLNDRARRAIEAGEPADEVFAWLTRAYGSDDAAWLVLDVLLGDIHDTINPVTSDRPGAVFSAAGVDDIVHSYAMHRVRWADDVMALTDAVEYAREWLIFFGKPPELVDALEHEIEWAEGRVRFYQAAGDPSWTYDDGSDPETR